MLWSTTIKLFLITILYLLVCIIIQKNTKQDHLKELNTSEILISLLHFIVTKKFLKACYVIYRFVINNDV